MKKYVFYLKLIFVNLLTASRLIGALILPIIYYYYDPGIVSIVVICLYATDLFDGFFARLFKVETFFGSLIDAVGDKLINLVTFLILGLIHPILFIPLAMELLIILVNSYAYFNYKNLKSSKIGKTKTMVVAIGIVTCLATLGLGVLKEVLNPNIINLLSHEKTIFYFVSGVMFGIQALTLIDYTLKAFKKESVKKKNNGKLMNFKEIFSILFDTKFYKENKNNSLKNLIYK